MSSVENSIAILVQTLEKMGFDKGSIIDREERARIAKEMKKATRTILTYFNFLEEEEYVNSIARGREIVFDLVTPPKEMIAKFSSLAYKLADKKTVLLLMNIEAREYLTKLCDEKKVDEQRKNELLNHFPI
jgi:hypothetical protein